MEDAFTTTLEESFLSGFVFVESFLSGFVFVESVFDVSGLGASFTTISPLTVAFAALLPSVFIVNLNVPVFFGVPEIQIVCFAESTLAETPDGRPSTLTPVQNRNS